MSGGNGHDDEDAAADPVEAAEEATGLAAADGGPDPATRLEEMRRERDELRDQLLRRRADFENYRKRVERDRSAAAEDARAALFKLLVPTLDNLDRALASPTLEGLREGLELTRRNLVAMLEAQGLVAMDPAGRPFDPERHQALTHDAVPGVPEDTVVEVYGKGYEYKDRLIRPAMVKVSKGDPPDDGQDPGVY